MTEGEQAILDYLAIMAKVTADRIRSGRQSPHLFMMHHGRSFTITPHTYEGARGTPKQCYSNAGLIAKRGRKGLVYAEGYVTCSGLPIPHAWLVNEQGEVIDPTLKGDDDIGRTYFGLAFDKGYHRVAILKSTYWSLLEFNGVALRDIIEGRTHQMLSTLHHPEKVA